MKNKGFTLIELLAVITILAIILTITVIAINSTISNSKNSLHKSQINQIEKAAEYYNNKEGLKDSGMCVNISYLLENGYLNDDKITDPKTGQKMFGSVKINYNGKKYSYEYDEKTCLCKATNELSIDRGTKYECYVNDNDTFNFYVLSTEEDKVSLIMDKNICGSAIDPNDVNNGKPATEENKCLIAWYDGDTNEFGPVTAMQGIYNATKDWVNVPDIKLDYSDEFTGYGKIQTNTYGIKIIKKDGITEVTRSENQTPVIPYEKGKSLKARLPKLSEVYKEDENSKNYCNFSGDSCPSWLVNNMVQKTIFYPNNDQISGIYGYWLLASSNDSVNAHLVNFYISVYNAGSSISGIGIRPVIEISTSDLTDN